jgi:dihydropteroate synthase
MLVGRRVLTLEDLAELWARHRPAGEVAVAEPEIFGQRFPASERPHLMGVVNLSPDSWYRESVALTVDAAIRRGLRLHAEGARLIDLGAESTLAHAARIDERAQIERLVPVVKGLAAEGVLVSIETYEPRVAEACFLAGAAVLNLTGTADTDRMYRIAAAHGGGVIACHVQGRNVREVGDFTRGADPVEHLLAYFSREVELATRAGVKALWLDPGLGFYYRNLQDSAERVRHQMQAFLHTFRLRSLGWPTCHALPHAFEYFEEEVRSAEPFFAVLAVLGKTDLLRTHEIAKVRGVVRALAVWEREPS